MKIGTTITTMVVGMSVVMQSGCNVTGGSAVKQDKAVVPVEKKAVDVKPEPAKKKPVVQIAVLLDTSNSMDGMINQAKTELWRIVNEFATAERDGQKPALEVALYQYGTPTLGADNGYIKQILPLTSDLDKVSQELFALKTNGGDEYCGWVIKTAVDQLAWSTNNNDYKAIFIAGNETFAQGKVDYKQSCKDAVTKGIIVNTIHCQGAEDTGWTDGAKLADGKALKIDSNKAIVQVDAPQDKEILALNEKLNKTYIAYGKGGSEKLKMQAEVDQKNASLGYAVMSQRAAAKSSVQYNNAGWDMVDAAKEQKLDVSKLKEEELPDEMKSMKPEERTAYVGQKQKEREEIQAQIKKLNVEREKYVMEETKKRGLDKDDTFGAAVRSTVREQAVKAGFVFGK